MFVGDTIKLNVKKEENLIQRLNELDNGNKTENREEKQQKHIFKGNSKNKTTILLIVLIRNIFAIIYNTLLYLRICQRAYYIFFFIKKGYI